MGCVASAEHPLMRAIEWNPGAPAERVNDFLLMSRGCSNSYVITSEAGDVVINTGAPAEREHRRRFEELLGRPLKVAKIVFTQDHFDHIGGWSKFADPSVEMIAQAEFPRLCRERTALAPFFGPRSQAVLHAMLSPSSNRPPAFRGANLPEPLTLFDKRHSFEVGRRRFELYSSPSGETLDSLMVWLPQERVLFTGNWMGALYGALPHFYTLRGDRDRSVANFMVELQHLIDLDPDLLVTGHGLPIVGEARIRADMSRLMAAIRYIHDETVRGMAEKKDLWTLMREIQLPEDLVMAPGRGPVSWYVRTVFEEYTGWFRQESTTELYGVPARTIWPELAQLAGGPDVLAGKAQERLKAGAPLEAIHYVEIALAADPKHQAALEVEIAAHEALLQRTRGRTFDEMGWLEGRIAKAKAIISTP
ncbi:MBL fold metallo-hydrolase [Phenylobacterium sp. LjRoot219]|uniref:MBL fold metallo-hydrolase n=1 Tax=Phenylobacterium sp. LjRoot219 TaxID=3342283 RepID=UPI003ECD58A2